MNFDDITLSGEYVTLVPLESSHEEGLLQAAADGELWNLWYTAVPSRSNITQYIQKALTEKKEKRSLPFTVIHKTTGKIIGATRYCNADHSNRRLEIGYTWYAVSFQKTAVNTECKLLLLQHAFEKLNCIAVEFRTHYFNHASRNAILRLGAKQDGILRNHRMDNKGVMRDSVVFSIINIEWPVVKQSLSFKLGRV